MEVDVRYTAEKEALGKNLRHLRTIKKMSQVDLEIATGINNGDISRIENGKANLEFYTLVKLAVALEVDLKTFFE